MLHATTEPVHSLGRCFRCRSVRFFAAFSGSRKCSYVQYRPRFAARQKPGKNNSPQCWHTTRITHPTGGATERQQLQEGKNRGKGLHGGERLRRRRRGTRIEGRVAIRIGRVYPAGMIKQFDRASRPINLVPHPSILAPPIHPEGLEPPTLGSEDRCSIQLSYGCRFGQPSRRSVSSQLRAKLVRPSAFSLATVSAWAEPNSASACPPRPRSKTIHIRLRST
jgi:hypothetical protein